jgi:hypothetical protein
MDTHSVTESVVDGGSEVVVDCRKGQLTVTNELQGTHR